MNDLDKQRLNALAAWMREHGAEHVVLTSDRLEVRLGPEPARPQADVKDPETAEAKAAREQREYERILYASSEGFSDT